MTSLQTIRWRTVAALLLALLLLVGCASHPAVVGTWPVVRITDGDTIRVMYEGREEPVRLLRINTPERGRPGYQESTEALRGMVEGRRVIVRAPGRAGAGQVRPHPGLRDRGRREREHRDDEDGVVEALHEVRGREVRGGQEGRGGGTARGPGAVAPG